MTFQFLNLEFIVKLVMSDTEDTVFVECSDGERESGDREPSVEVLPNNSNNGEVTVQPDVMGEREDIVQVALFYPV